MNELTDIANTRTHQTLLPIASASVFGKHHQCQCFAVCFLFSFRIFAYNTPTSCAAVVFTLLPLFPF